MSFLPPWATEKSGQQYCIHICRISCQAQIYISTGHLFPYCFGTFFISSFLFYFVLTLSENNLNRISTQLAGKMVNAHTLQQRTSLTLNWPRIECQDHTKHSAEADTTTARLTHVPPKTQYWAYYRLQNKLQNTPVKFLTAS